MIRLNCDYNEGAHPRILKRLAETNMEQTPGYGEDEYCRQASKKIKEACLAPNADVHFLVGGTQANLVVIAASLRPHQCAVCADTGHINVHESGAIESCGHKVMPMPTPDGKLTAAQVEETYRLHVSDEAKEHIAQPKLVYISHPTELGTVYTKKELQEISDVCKEHGLILYLDGARLGYGLCAEGSDLGLSDIARCCDAFYIGGTKVGALFGEAVVITNDRLKEDFRYIIKQKGGMLAKGRLLGIQFLELFTDGLYTQLGRRGVMLAARIKRAFLDRGYPLLVNSTTNQQFVILPDTALPVLEENYSFAYIKRIDANHSAVRFCTSWATKEQDVDQFITDIAHLPE